MVYMGKRIYRRVFMIGITRLPVFESNEHVRMFLTMATNSVAK